MTTCTYLNQHGIILRLIEASLKRGTPPTLHAASHSRLCGQRGRVDAQAQFTPLRERGLCSAWNFTAQSLQLSRNASELGRSELHAQAPLTDFTLKAVPAPPRPPTATHNYLVSWPLRDVNKDFPLPRPSLSIPPHPLFLSMTSQRTLQRN